MFDPRYRKGLPYPPFQSCFSSAHYSDAMLCIVIVAWLYIKLPSAWPGQVTDLWRSRLGCHRAFLRGYTPSLIPYDHSPYTVIASNQNETLTDFRNLACGVDYRFQLQKKDKNHFGTSTSVVGYHPRNNQYLFPDLCRRQHTVQSRTKGSGRSTLARLGETTVSCKLMIRWTQWSSVSPQHYIKRFNVPPDPRGSTVPWSRVGLEFLGSFPSRLHGTFLLLY